MARHPLGRRLTEAIGPDATIWAAVLGRGAGGRVLVAVTDAGICVVGGTGEVAVTAHDDVVGLEVGHTLGGWRVAAHLRDGRTLGWRRIGSREGVRGVLMAATLLSPSLAVPYLRGLPELLAEVAGGAGTFVYPRAGRSAALAQGLPLAVVVAEAADAPGRLGGVAIARLAPEGDVVSRWSADLDPVARPEAFEAIAAEVLELLEGSIVVAHGGDAVETLLLGELRRSGVQLPSLPALCTLRLARQLWQAEDYSLAACCRRSGVPLPQGDRPADVADAVGRLALALLAEAGAVGWDLRPPALPLIPGRRGWRR